MQERIPEIEAMLNPHEVKEYNLLCRKYLAKLGYKVVSDVLKKNGVVEGKIIDLGTGSGWLSIELARENRNLQIVGVDISKQMLILARQNIKSFLYTPSIINLVEANVKRLPFRDDSFDAAVSYASLHHWSGNLLEIFEEIYRIVKNKGLVVIHDLKRDDKNLLFLRVIPSKIMRKLLEFSVKASYAPDEIRAFLKKSDITKDWQVIENAMGLGIEGRVVK